IRSCAFLIVDGVLPSNEGRGYVLRRIIRRAIRHGYMLGVTETFFYKLVKQLCNEMGEAYPELLEQQSQVEKVLRLEEERFAQTLEQGMKILDEAIAELDGKVIPGETVFKLYDTYGFPKDLTADIARERDLTIDQPGFDKAMAAQRKRAQAASQFGASDSVDLDLEGETQFSGYDSLEDQADIVAILRDGESVETLHQGESGMIFLDHTPFYAESGGQVGDMGTLEGKGVFFEVEDTRKQSGELFAHIGKLEEGNLSVGETVTAQVNAYTRQATALNHSATHLLHAALRQVLGDHVAQKGSLVDAERLRFDFSHFEPITREQLQTIEQMVNEQIRHNHLVDTKLMSLEQAKTSGAMALFGEKYADQVRVLSMGDFSTELCGGTHVNAVGDIGLCKITAETGIAAGVRRIEAVTGQRAIEWMEADEERVQRIAEMIKSGRDEIEDKLEHILERNRKLEKELDQLKGKLASAAGSDLASGAVAVGEVKVLAANLDGADPKSLRETMDQLKNKLGSAVILLATVAGGKVSLVAGVTKDLTSQMKAGELVKLAAEQVGGKGGGRPDMAQAGGNNPDALPQALALVEPWVRDRLGA
ncbi:MAG: alanine--tRNA ligase, partial [Candidatus Thiodiazotropha sp. (ex Cardiolucina cf. quadrata)]|nr:alanine--tRNA ligase [Candidatus Thiodiazotropha sp. (ex Cardiolucina cf. quadrata)]